MKILILITFFITNILFANYVYSGQNSGQIDMHGGKGDMLINNKNSLSNSKLNSLGNMGINKPKVPVAPQTLIKEKKKVEEKKEINK